MAEEPDVNAQVGEFLGSQNSPIGASAQGKINLPINGLQAVVGLFNQILTAIKELNKEIPSVVEGLNDAAATGQNVGMGGGTSKFRSRTGGAINGVMQALTRSSTTTGGGMSGVTAALSGGRGGAAVAGARGAMAAAGGSGAAAAAGGPIAAAVMLALDKAKEGVRLIDKRIDENANYSLSADRMSVLYQQMTGMSQTQVQDRLRQPLTNYRLGMGGINTMLGMQARTGLSAAKQAPSAEALRTISGFSLSTNDAANMISALGSPESVNRMFMMTGQSMYGFGGRQRSAMDVIQNVTKLAGLTNKSIAESAFQQGSASREMLRQMGIPEEMIDTVLQYSMQNISYREKGGTGMYDPSKKEHRKLMGIEENFATQAEETERVRARREENFYSRQADNFASLEKSTQRLTEAFGALEDKLSGIIGARTSTRPFQRILGKIGSIISPGLQLLGLGGAGDGAEIPSNHPVSVRQPNAMVNNRGGVDPVTDPISQEDMAYAQGLANHRVLNGLDPSFKQRIVSMVRANPRLRVNGGFRPFKDQWNMFFHRHDYVGTQEPADLKTNPHQYRYYEGGVTGPNGETKPIGWYKRHPGTRPAAPPNMSLHNIGFAVDFNNYRSKADEEWVRKNAPKFGLIMPDPVTDEVHVQQLGLFEGAVLGRSGWGGKGRKWIERKVREGESGIIGAPSKKRVLQQIKSIGVDPETIDIDALMLDLEAMDKISSGATDVQLSNTPFGTGATGNIAMAPGSVYGAYGTSGVSGTGAGSTASGHSSKFGDLSGMSIDQILKMIQKNRKDKFKSGRRLVSPVVATPMTPSQDNMGDAYTPSPMMATGMSMPAPQLVAPAESSIGTRSLTLASSKPVVYNISPVIHIGDASNVSNVDLRRMAKEVGRLLEQEVNTRSLRRR